MNNWMTNPEIQKLPLKLIAFPGTHDSGTYGITSELASDPKYGYGSLDFLWRLQIGQAPGPPTPTSPLYVSQGDYNFIIQVVQSTAQAQTNSIGQSLADGIRSFDLRVYFDTNMSGYYTQHALRCAPLDEILQDVQTFVSQLDTNELVILEVSHSNFTEQAGWADGFVELVQSYLQDYLYYDPSFFNLPNNANFQQLGNVVLGNITSSGSRVLVLNLDGNIYPAGSPFMTASGFEIPADSSASGVPTVQALQALQATGIVNSNTCMYSAQWCLTPDLPMIAETVVPMLNGNSVPPVLQNAANLANAALDAYFQSIATPPPGFLLNRVNCDWYPSELVSLCVQQTRFQGKC